MMYSSPYFHTPFFTSMYRRYPPRYAFPQEKINTTKTTHSNQNSNTSEAIINLPKKGNVLNPDHSLSQEKNTNNVGATICSPLEKETSIQKNRSCEDKPIFEIFGFKLFFDDLLILGLLFFLYSEGVQDQELFLALILLLLS